MNEKINQLGIYFEELFGKEEYNNSYIELIDQGDMVLSANEEGYIHLIDQILKLCKKKSDYEHYHLDEAGMADKCEKSLVIKYKKAPWL